MMQVEFEGWFQCRLASDPDPTDEPRGISGCTFALVGEPDLDRIIRLQKPGPEVVRHPGPEIGVTVNEVAVNGAPVADHPLLGAQLELRNDARFQELNGVLAKPKSAFIDPFDLQISKNEDLSIRRAALWDIDDPDCSIYALTPEAIKPRQPLVLEIDSAEVLNCSGILDPTEYRDTRTHQLKELLEQESDALAIARLKQRIEAQELSDWRGQRLLMLLGARVMYRFQLNQPEPKIVDKHKQLGELSDDPWLIEFWMGGWDNDSFCAYMKGTLLTYQPGKHG
jgi:hypothetical protein